MSRPYPHFTHEELACRCCGKMQMVPEFMRKIETLRTMYGKPLPVASGFRCNAHNALVSSTGANGPHTTGRAIDLRVSGQDAFKLLQLASASHVFSGFGIKQTGPHSSRFIHIDDLSGPTRPWCWSYP